MIKKYKKDKEAEEKKKLDGQLRLQTLKASKLKEELQRRQVQVGIPSNVGGVK